MNVNRATVSLNPQFLTARARPLHLRDGPRLWPQRRANVAVLSQRAVVATAAAQLPQRCSVEQLSLLLQAGLCMHACVADTGQRPGGISGRLWVLQWRQMRCDALQVAHSPRKQAVAGHHLPLSMGTASKPPPADSCELN